MPISCLPSMIILCMMLNSITAHEILPSIPSSYISSFFHAFQSENVRIVNYPEKGLGFMSLSTIPEGGIVLCIDEELQLSADDQFPLYKYLGDLPDTEKLKVRLLYEKFLGQPENFITKYVHSLPEESAHPGLWTKSQAEYFNKVILWKNEEKDFLEIENFHRVYEILKKIPEIPKNMMKIHSYLWASFIVRSRSFVYESEEKDLKQVLVPYLDFANFYPNPLKWRDLDSFIYSEGKYCLRTLWSIYPGDEFVYQYQNLNSFLLFTRYGITFETNPYDYFEASYKSTQLAFYADRINLKLLQTLFHEISGKSLKCLSNLKKCFNSMSEHDQNIMVNALVLYKRVYKELTKVDKIGLRELMRLGEKYRDKTMMMITKFGASERKTVYNHLRTADRELLFTLNRLI